MTGPAAEAWARALAGWALPQEIVDEAPETPWCYPPAVFEWTPERAAAEAGETPSRRRAREAVPEDDSVLDVGVGGGRGSVPLAPPAKLLVGVDPSVELLAAFARAAERLGIAHRTVHGQWPAVAPQVEPQDVVICNHVIYNVADLVPFAAALTDHARRRVVLELTREHPASNLNEAWRVLHGIERPSSPTATDAVAVLQEMGLDVHVEEGERALTPAGETRADVVTFARRRLCVGPERDVEIDALLGPDFEAPLRRIVTVWWDGTA